MSIIKDCLMYYFLSLVIYYFFKCRYLKLQLFNQREIFIKTIGNDFRIPLLAQIRGLDLIQKKIKFSDNEIYLVEEINNSCKYTLDMISMLLKIYRIENNDISLNYESVNVSSTISEIFKNAENVTKEKEIVLKCYFEDIHISADRENLVKMLNILINTALLYSDKNTVLNISLYKSFSNYKLKIQYIGRAISNEEYNRMFLLNPAYSAVGHGIQMFLCKKIVDMHNWKIEYISEVNKNSFVISIPVKTDKIFQFKRIYRTFSV